MRNAMLVALTILFFGSVVVGVAILDNTGIWPSNSSHDQGGGIVDNGDDTPSVEFAHVFSTREEACAELQRRHPAPVGLQAAMADSKLLGPTLVGPREDIRMVGVSKCGELHVVIVGVTGAESQVPARGPQGTPIIAFLQPAFHATA